MGTRPAGGLDGQVNHAQPFIVRQSRRFAGGAAGDQKVDARLHLPAHQVAQGGFIEAAILLEGSDQGSTASTQFHRRRIILRGGNLKKQDSPQRHREHRKILVTTEDTEITECSNDRILLIAVIRVLRGKKVLRVSVPLW